MSDLKATLKTNRGDIVVDLFPNHAPKTVDNFVGLAEGSKDYTDDAGRSGVPYYDGLVFHRVINGFMIQGGCPLGEGRGGPGYTFADEIHPELRFDKPYLLAMANAGPGTNGSQFFITVGADARGSTASTPSSARSPTRPRATSSTRSPRPRSGPATARATRSSSSPSRSTGPDPAARASTCPMSDASPPGSQPPVGVPTCYRHPDRETYIACQRCSRPICPDCMRDAAVGLPVPAVRRRGREDDPRRGARRTAGCARATPASPRWC